MTQDEIIEMAINASLNLYVNDLTEKQYMEVIEHFAKQVAQHEREACAKVCEETTASWTQYLYNEGCTDCAKGIRARGQA